MAEGEGFPRSLTAREQAWLDYILPADRPGYAEFRAMIAPLVVLGEGRWGSDDFILGRPGQEIDRTEGMLPVMAYGEIACATADDARFTITLAVHQPNDDAMIEFQVGTLDIVSLPEHYRELSRWTYSTWLPGAPCPATGEPVRQITLNRDGDLLLVISPSKRRLWLYDAHSMVSTLIPITNFYNELMLLKGVRDPKIALEHNRLFTELAPFTDEELRGAFMRYNIGFRKVAHERLAHEERKEEGRSLFEKITSIFKGGR